VNARRSIPAGAHIAADRHPRIIRLPALIDAALVDAAAEQSISVNVAVQRAVAAWLANQETRS